MEDRPLLPIRSGNMVGKREASELLDETQENPCIIDDFLDDQVGNSSEVSAIREMVLNAAQGHYSRDLQNMMSDLRLFINKPDDEEIVTALYDYRRSRHLLINDDMIMQMRAAEDGFREGAFQKDGNTQDIPMRTQTVGIPDCDETLEEFSRRHDKFCTSLSDTFFVYDGAQVQLSQEKHGPRMDVESLDNILGIAGFRPEKSLGLLPDKNLGSERKPKPEEFKMEDFKKEGLKELQDHVRVEKTKSGFCAEVSLKPFSSFATQDHNIEDIYRHLVTIISIYSRIAKVKEKLRSIGSLGHEIVYLKRRGAATRRSLGLIDTGEADLHFTDGYIIETVSLNMETLDELFTTVNNFYDKFQKSSERTRANQGWFWSAVSAILTVGSFIASSLGFPALIGVGLMALASNFTSGWGSATDDERMAAVSAFGESAEPILGRLQLPAVQNSPISPSMLQNISTLHKIALTGQFISLLFQSHIRGSSAPFDFEGLVDCPISHFRLRGTDPNAPSICAFSQKLACFPDQKVLIFDTAEDNSPSALQLQITPAHMMILWRPVNVIMHRKDARHTGVTFCAGLAAMGGIITPDETPGTGPRLWRWKEPQKLDAKMLFGQEMLAIGLHDKIRLGSYHESLANQLQESKFSEMPNSPRGYDTDDGQPTVASTQEQSIPIQTTEISSADVTISVSTASLQDPKQDKAILQREEAEDSSAACQWDEEKAEEKRRSQMSEYSDQSGTMSGSVKLEAIQFGPSLQPGIVPFGAQLVATWRFSSLRPLKLKLLRKDSGLISSLDEYCCTFMSLHTGVIERVRLRDMVAYFALSKLVDAAVCGPSLDEVIPILMSDSDVLKWMDKEIPSPKEKEELGTQLNNLIKETLDRLENSGISRRKNLVVLWPGRPFKQLKILRREEKWIPILSDTLTTSTFACVVRNCQETHECKCPMAQSPADSRDAVTWRCPDTFRLKTTLHGHNKFKNKTEEKIRLLTGKAYWINDYRLNLIAIVLGSVKPIGGKPLYYILVRSTLVPGFLMKHFKAYPTVTEAKEVDSFDCIVGSGDEFKREVERHLERFDRGEGNVQN